MFGSPLRGRSAAGLVTAALLLLLASCGGRQGAAPPASPSASTKAKAASTAPSATVSPAAPRSSRVPASGTKRASGGPDAVTKLLVVVVENHSLDQMAADMPYTFGLAKRYGYASGYHAITHPSLPNYLAIAGGDTYGVTDDAPPSAHPVPGRSVFQQALDHGKTAGLYAEAMPANCTLDAQGTYAVKHNPWAYFAHERGACSRYDRPLTDLGPDVAAGRLPNAGMVIPDLCNDAHDCGLSTADSWLRRLMGEVLRGPDWRSGHLAVVVTADEDDHNQGNKVLTVVVHPSQHHHVVADGLDHYSLARLYDDVLHVPRLNRAATAPSMSRAFGLPLAPAGG